MSCVQLSTIAARLLTERLIGMSTWIDRYLDAQWLEKGLAENSLQSYGRDLRLFDTWLQARGRSLVVVDAADLMDYLGARLEAGGARSSSARLLSSLRSFYQHDTREGWIAGKPQARPSPAQIAE